MKRSLLLSACGLVLYAGVFAQKDDRKPDAWPVEVRLNVKVTDSAGKPVDNISASDIKLYENGVEQKSTYFEKRPVSRVAFVMDNTGSMRGLLAPMESIGNAIVDKLDKTEGAAVIRFVSSDKISLDQPLTTNKALIKKAFSRMFTEGGETALRDAVYMAEKSLLDGAKDNSRDRSAIILITDGEDRNSYYKDSDLLSLIRGTNLQIFVVGLTSDLNNDIGFIRQNPKEKAISFLQTFALRTGGAAYILDSPRYKSEDIDAMVASLIVELHSPFVIGYTSTDQNHDGQWRKMRVEIADGPNGEKRSGVVRSGFVVPKN